MLLRTQVRHAFDRLLVKGEDVMTAQLDCPESTKVKWLSQSDQSLLECPAPTLNKIGRRLNNFCLGSDPEFVFVPPGGGHKANAAELGLKPGLAAGCDQNQRLAELRGWPTSSALEHTAGILSALRWMYRVYPNVRGYDWRAGAWFDGDGIGGHVHFGRKRPTRENETKGLDGLASVFRAIGFFPLIEWDRRNRPDAHHQVYGIYGDIRPQLHGYEYRTLPSWLNNPAKAFAVLATAKLCVLDPELPASWKELRGVGPGGYKILLQRLANYYAGRDDDAWILKYLLAQPENPCYQYATPDFKINWGFNNRLDRPSAVPTNIIPACIRPLASEVTEIEANLLQAKPLSYVENSPTFKNTLPAGPYYWVPDPGVRGIARGGVGDLVHNMVGTTDRMLSLIFDEGFSVSYDLVKEWTRAEMRIVRTMYPKMKVSATHNRTIIFSRQMTLVPDITKTRTFLLKMGLFPLWTVDTVEVDSFDKYKAERRKLSLQPRIEERNI